MRTSSPEPGDRGGVAVVTGAAGFIGRHLTRRLVAEGWTVRAVDLHAFAGDAAELGSSLHEMDIRDPAALEAVLEGAETVFHLASAHLQVGAPRGWYESVNVDAAAALVTACSRAGVRQLVHTSSVGIYGHVEHPPADEDSPKRPANEYERTKLQGETIVIQKARELEVDLVVLRPGWVYGPGCPRTAKLLDTVRRGRFLYVGDGSNLRHPIYVADAVQAFLLAARAPEHARGRPYLVVGPRAVTVRELVECCAAALGVATPSLRLPRALVSPMAWIAEVGFGMLRREPPLSRRSLAFFDNDNSFDGRAAEEHLGFRPTIDLPRGLQDTVATLGLRAPEGSA